MDMNSKLFHDEETNVVYLSSWQRTRKKVTLSFISV